MPHNSDHLLSPKIMGVLNVTPDSFFDGGKYFKKDDAIARGHSMINEGVDYIDVGGESTRPGSNPVDENDQINRVCPVISALSSLDKKIVVSVDTRSAKVMESAIEAGAKIVNDVSSLTKDTSSIEIIKKSNVGIILMHSLDDPKLMQVNPQYSDVVSEVFSYLKERVNYCIQNGISQDRIIVDPGIGFGKTVIHNLKLLKNISVFHSIGCPVMLGTSRKSFIGKIDGDKNVNDRLGGSLATVIYGLKKGVKIFRVHDVIETVQAIKTYQSIEGIK
jgi:dihydropteroate synthase|tara:strand:- start:10 stop:837 length:828 start_codon:yes stop_codon:yes gene_type:complete